MCIRDRRWGVLSTAAIGVKKVIPGMQKCKHARVTAIASRDLTRARKAADALGIPAAYGSYEDLLADPEIDAIYNPLPNQLHVPWTIKAAEAGKHVLCEKPISMSSGEARELLAVRARTGVKMGEAFMTVSYTHLPTHVGNREMNSIFHCYEFRSDAVSYTHLDVYKRQGVIQWLTA